MAVPPGVIWILTRLPTLLVPSVAIYVLNKYTLAVYGYALPTWTLVLVTTLSFPATVILRSKIKDFKDHRAAAAHGAVVPPSVYDPYPGGIGLLLVLIRNLKNGYPGDRLEERSAKYGHTYKSQILWENRFITTEPDHIKAILATRFDSFEKGPDVIYQMNSFLGSGVFNSDGEMWKFHRAMTRPFFSKDRITHFEIFERHIKDAFSQIRERQKEGYPVDIQDVASRFTMDSATEFLFAKDVQSLAAGLPYPHYASNLQTSISYNHPANVFSRSFDEAQKRVGLRMRWGGMWPLVEFWGDKVKAKMGPVFDFINPILNDAVQRMKDSGKDVAEKSRDREIQDDESLLDHLINYTDDKTVLRDETLNILLAGRDTTTNSITYAIYMLSKHPEVLERLRAEVLEKVGSGRAPTYDDMKDMKFLRAVINETLRLYPAVPFNVRMSNDNAVVLPAKNGEKPFYIPPRSRFSYSVFMMHRRKDLWGPDAHLFDPDRFLDDRLQKYLTPNPFIFLPFNAGPRICLGQQFAYHETSYFLIRLLQNFSVIDLAPEAQPPESLPPPEWKNELGSKSDSLRLKCYLTMSIMGGCWVRLKEAEADA